MLGRRRAPSLKGVHLMLLTETLVLSRATGGSKPRLAYWNAEGVRQKKTELQTFLKQTGIDVCTIQETHLTVNYRCYVRGYETCRQDRESRSKGGVVTLVRNAIPSIEIQRSGASDPEFLGVEHVQPDHHLQVFNIYSHPSPMTNPLLSVSFSPPQKTGSSWETLTATLPAGDTMI